MFKIIGVIIGILVGSFALSVLGFLIGSVMDFAVNKAKNSESPESLARIQTTFFETTFALIGYIAKCDGVIAQEEIDQTQALMDKMGLNALHKREAIRLFKAGAHSDFELQPTLNNFLDNCGHKPQLVYVLMSYLINTVLADNKLHRKEEIALQDISRGLHFSHTALDQLLRMLRARGDFSQYSQGYDYGSQNHQQQEQYQNRASHSQLQNAYTTLGVNESDNNATIKKAYRKLISEYHPDKLIGQGVPEDMIKIATERSQEIQQAYDLIKKNR